MKQLLQDLSNGNTTIVDAPTPKVKAGHLLIDTQVSMISAGTKRMIVNFGNANLIQKARQQPEKVKQVINKVQTDGLMTTVNAVKSKLAQPIPLGYSNVGVVREVGVGVTGFQVGDRVVSNGRHADVVLVPKHLCAKIPDGVTNEQAVFTVVSSIGLQGIRLAQPTLGERIAVYGAGLIGLLTIQMLIANGCKVLAIDIDEEKLKLAEQFGASTCCVKDEANIVSEGMNFSDGAGVDAVIITASAKTNDIVSEAAQMSRKRGRIILVGVVGLQLNRADFYEKELTFQVSCSYGPGRYDPDYEEKGNDYPEGFVRWTEQRNFQAVLEMMQNGQVDSSELLTHRYEFTEAASAYTELAANNRCMGIVLKYSEEEALRHVDTIQLQKRVSWNKQSPVIAVVGAGNYASRVMIPAYHAAGVQLHTLVSQGGVNASVVGKKNGFAHATTDYESILNSDEINTIVIATRHHSHATLAKQAIEHGKHVIVEKPLALTIDEVNDLEGTYHRLCKPDQPQYLLVGYNRRFSPFVIKAKELLNQTSGPKSFVFTMNAGNLPDDHWTKDVAIGGGRIIGEACHYIDLMRHLVGDSIINVSATCVKQTSKPIEDIATITLEFADGSIGTIHYFTNGHTGFPKERIEVFADGKMLVIDNFRKMTGYGWPNFKKLKTAKQDKGQQACPAVYIQALTQGLEPPISPSEVFEVARYTCMAGNLLRS